MAEVKWIKLCVDMFDNRKIKQIRKLPGGNDMVLFWVMLLNLAGKANSQGYILFTENIAYTPEMLATECGFEIQTIQAALRVFEQFNMIELDKLGISIIGWEEHQSAAKLDAIREYNALAQQKSRLRKKQKLLSEASNVNDSQKNVNDSQGKCQTCQDTEVDKEEDIDIDIDIDYRLILETWNQLPPPIKTLRRITTSRKKKIKAKINQGITVDDMLVAIRKISESSFLKGTNNQNWVIDFDWVFKNDSNITKILEGKYDNRQNQGEKSNGSFGDFEQRKYDFGALERDLLEAHNAR